jgi:hypothetical protein
VSERITLSDFKVSDTQSFNVFFRQGLFLKEMLNELAQAINLGFRDLIQEFV